MIMTAWLRSVVFCLCTLVPHSLASGAPADSGGSSGRPGTTECGSVRSGEGRLNDYRAFHADAQLTWSVGDIKRNHLDPAVERMKQGEFSHRVLADLDFMLRGWPNHHAALEAAIRYELGGGKPYELLTTACYLARATEFAPDDVRVLFLEAYYYWQRGDRPLARDIYEESLAIHPDSIDVHYNLGLVYFELEEYEKSMYHAGIAYRGGYPLPGLRKKLEGVRKWQNDFESVSAKPQE